MKEEPPLPGQFFVKLDGEPVGKGRPRFSPKTGTVYTPAKTASYESRLAWAAQAAMRGRPLYDGPLAVYIMASVSIPVSKSKQWKTDALAGRIWPTKKPDPDNIAKMVDALNKVVWVDDCQIVILTVKKVYSDRPCLWICVDSLSDPM